MARLVSIATGRRPRTAEAALWAFSASYGVDDLVVVSWAPPAPSIVYGAEIARIVVMGGTKARCQNAALQAWQDEHDGDLPDVWFTMDDDVVLGRGAIEACEAVLASAPSIGLVSVMNDCTEQQARRANDRRGGEDICRAHAFDFTVGGALHGIPRRTLERGVRYDETRPRHDDWMMTRDVIAAGFDVAMIVSRYAVCLPDDGLDPSYRDDINAANSVNAPS